MMRLARDVRLIPIVLVATICLFALKVSGLVFDGGYTLAERMDHNRNDLKIVPAESVSDFPKIVAADGLPRDDDAARQSWAKQMFNFGSDVTGSVEKDEKSKEPALPSSNKPPAPAKIEVGNVSVPLERGRIASAGETAVLERLRDRKQELDARTRELDMRENLIKAAEKRLEAKVAELKDTEAKVNAMLGNRDKAQAQRFNSIVSMYENMKPKEAARIFERLDMAILVDVSTKINPRKMADILAQMSPDAAERLTVELASRAGGAQKAPGAGQLPKIEGQASAQ